MQERRLDTNRRLGDVDGIAAAQWGLARIDMARGDDDAAVARLAEAYRLLERLGRVDGLAVVGETYGRLLAATSSPHDGAAVARRSAEAYRKLGREDDARRADAMLDELGTSGAEERTEDRASPAETT